MKFIPLLLTRPPEYKPQSLYERNHIFHLQLAELGFASLGDFSVRGKSRCIIKQLYQSVDLQLGQTRLIQVYFNTMILSYKVMWFLWMVDKFLFSKSLYEFKTLEQFVYCFTKSKVREDFFLHVGRATRLRKWHAKAFWYILPLPFYYNCIVSHFKKLHINCIITLLDNGFPLSLSYHRSPFCFSPFDSLYLSISLLITRVPEYVC